MAVTLHEAGLFSWPEFQAALIRRISDWQEQSAPRQPWSYYEHWLDALTEVLAATGHLPSEMVHARAHLLAARPAGDDHAH